MAAKSQPIAVGDRVRNPKLAPAPLRQSGRYDSGAIRYRVRFDAHHRAYDFWRDKLERLIPGDEGFEPPAIPKEVPTCPWDKGVRASDVPIASHTVKTQNNYDDEF